MSFVKLVNVSNSETLLKAGVDTSKPEVSYSTADPSAMAYSHGDPFFLVEAPLASSGAYGIEQEEFLLPAADNPRHKEDFMSLLGAAAKVRSLGDRT